MGQVQVVYSNNKYSYKPINPSHPFALQLVEMANKTDYRNTFCKEWPLEDLQIVLWLKKMCKPGCYSRIYEIGYTHILFETPPETLPSMPWGLVAKTESDFNVPANFFLWESKAVPSSRDELEWEAVLNELRSVEKLSSGRPLFFYIPYKESPWLKDVIADLGPKTTFVFSSKAGSPEEDHQAAHPYWQHVKKGPLSRCAHLPVFNLGSIDNGEGLWPVLHYDALGMIANLRDPFNGFIALTNTVPQKGSVQDANLTLGAMAARGFYEPEIWFKAYRPDWDYPQNAPLLKEVYGLSLDLKKLKTFTLEKGRPYAELLLQRLKWIEGQVPMKRGDKPHFSEYFQYFARDFKKLVQHALHEMNLPMANILLQDDLKESFWTETQGGMAHGLQAGVRVLKRQSPFIGNPQTRQYQIALENGHEAVVE